MKPPGHRNANSDKAEQKNIQADLLLEVFFFSFALFLQKHVCFRTFSLALVSELAEWKVFMSLSMKESEILHLIWTFRTSKLRYHVLGSVFSFHLEL